MKRIVVFIFALFAIFTAHAEYTVLCPEDYYIVDEHCVACPAGTTNPAGSNTECTRRCPDGEYYGKVGLKWSCRACPDEYSHTDPDATSADECYSDPKIRENDGTVACRTIPDGCTYAKCTVCESETAPCEYVEYYDGTVKSGCSVACVSDIIDTAYNSTDKLPYNPESGICGPCGPGTYTIIKLTGVSCHQCAAGKYNPNSGADSSSACIACPAGTYSDAGAATCTPCPAGTYSNTTGTAECTPCPDGTTSVTGATSASQCVEKICDAGYYGDGETCTKCPDEYPNSNVGTTMRARCYSDVQLREWVGGQSTPDTLPDGCADATYGECKIDSCEYTVFCNSFGNAECSGGSIKSGCETNDTNCVKPILSVTALPGYHVAGDKCEQCPAGTYSPGGDATECVQCPKNTYSAAGASECTPCPDDYPNADAGSTSVYECYSNVKERPWTGYQVCTVPNGCIGAVCTPCEIKPCKYVARKKFMSETVISGCATNNANCSTPIQSLVAAPGWRTVGVSQCEICPAGTYSAGGDTTTCEACPAGAITKNAGAASRDECARILNYLPKGETNPTKILLKLKKNTSPALAVQIGDDVFYGNMTPVDAATKSGLYVEYNNQQYQIQDNKFFYAIANSFYVTTTPDTTEFTFSMTAMGSFAVDWGDGIVENIVRDNTTYTTYSHTYDVAGEYTIEFSGRATGYNSACYTRVGLKKIYTPVISFSGNSHVAKISGSLGNIFPIIDGNNPSYNRTFYGCTNLSGQIPVRLFGSLSGAPHSCMFQSTFEGTPKLTGIPAQNPDGTPLYDIEYNGEKWIDAYPTAFTDMYTNSGINADL